MAFVRVPFLETDKSLFSVFVNSKLLYIVCLNTLSKYNQNFFIRVSNSCSLALNKDITG